MLEQPDIRPFITRKGWAYRLNQIYVYEWEYGGVRRRLRIAAGFLYDGASSPRFLWTLTGIERDGPQRAAALIHDAMYRCKGRPQIETWIVQEVWSEERQEWEVEAVAQWTRRNVDRLFCRILREGGVPVVKRRMMYRGVRLFGWMFWRDKDERS